MSTLKSFAATPMVLVDENDRVLGFKEKFATHKNPVPLHRAISVVIFDKTKSKMLLQKRSRFKPTWPLHWSNACCSHPFKNETYPQAAKRRLGEEMGIKTPLKEKFKFLYAFEYTKIWGEHELDHVFVGQYSGEVKPDPKEAADFKWIGVNALVKDIQQNPKLYTPWFRIILEKLKVL